MNGKQVFILITGFLMIGVPAALADRSPDSKDETSDRMRYQKLMREMKSADAEYNKALKGAVLETEREGKASLETKSRLMSLANKRDRLVNRIMLLALRHGWAMPGTERPQEESDGVPDERQRIFEPADRMIKERFARDTRRIAAKIALPLISIQTVKLRKKAR